MDQDTLTEVLTLRQRRRGRNDTTLSLDGTLYELDQGISPTSSSLSAPACWTARTPTPGSSTRAGATA